MRKILHIGKFYPPHRGGMEQVLYDLVSRQSKQYQASVLCCSDRRKTTSELRDGADITRVACLTRMASMPVCPALLWRIRDYQPDLIHLHTPNPLGAIAVTKLRLQCPVVIHHHSDTLGRRALRLFSDPFVRTAMARADVVIATSTRYYQSSPELRSYRHKTVVIPCGITLRPASSVILTQAAQLRQTWGDRLIVAVGRLVPYKGFDVLIQAMQSVDGTLLIIGDGPLHGKLATQIADANLLARVHLLARVSDVEPYLRAAAVFAMPSISRAEAFGLVQVEAMACGTPVVNTDLDSGVPEVSLHGLTGLTVPPGKSTALASALNLLLEDGQLREQYGNSASLRASRLFTADSMAHRVEEVYRKLGVVPVELASPRILTVPTQLEASVLCS